MVQKGEKIRILRKESYWFNDIGTVVIVDQKSSNYPILARFTKVNYSGTNTASFKVEEVIKL